MPIDIDVVPESTYITNYNENVRALWLGLLAGPVIYALYFVVSYLLAEGACQAGFLNWPVAGISLHLLLIEGLTILATLLTLGSALYGYRIWRRQRHAHDHAGGALPFMAFGGLLLSLLFTLFIVCTGIAVAFINLCGWI